MLILFSVSDALSSSMIVPHEVTSVESSQDDQSPVVIRIVNEELCSLIAADVLTNSTLSSDGVHT